MTKVKLYEKKLKDGQRGLYLDFYPPIMHPVTGKPTRREHLRLYVTECPKDKTEENYNKEVRSQAETIRAKRESEIQTGQIKAANCSHKCASRAYKARAKGVKIEISNKETVQTKVAPIVELQAKEFLSAADACRLLGISRQTLWRAIKNGQLFAARIGRRIVISRAEIARLTER